MSKPRKTKTSTPIPGKGKDEMTPPVNTCAPEPLRLEEYSVLRLKMLGVESSHGALIEASEEVASKRAELSTVQEQLREAEANLREVQEEHQQALRDASPLLNRLPTV